MNIKRMTRLAEVLEAPQDPKMPGFNMAHWFVRMTEEDREVVYLDKFLWQVKKVRQTENSCGTAACAAGYACFLWPKEVDLIWGYSYNAQNILSLDAMNSYRLFSGTFDAKVADESKPLSKLTRKQVAREIRRMIKREMDKR